MDTRVKERKYVEMGQHEALELAGRMEFLADRLVHVYGESPNTDYIARTRDCASELRRIGTA